MSLVPSVTRCTETGACWRCIFNALRQNEEEGGGSGYLGVVAWITMEGETAW